VVTFSFPALRQLVGLPEPAHSFYGVLIGIWIGLFGLAYLRVALSKCEDRTFLALGAFGKLSFFVLALVYFFRSELGILALMASSIDAVLAGMFLIYLAKTKEQ
jgi:NhaP-type Na+/H+ or K+/H+ antiporter